MLLPKQCYGNERLRSFISFSRPQIILAAAIASLPGGFFLFVFNYLRMGMRKHAFFCLLFAFLLSVGLVVLFLSLPASRIDRFFSSVVLCADVLHRSINACLFCLLVELVICCFLCADLASV